MLFSGVTKTFEGGKDQNFGWKGKHINQKECLREGENCYVCFWNTTETAS